ncbi:uncharacterized protein B4U79_12280 [Dinothrombium tinctorium]|uniref:[histone H3]-lysine(36) N-trimethyltransferase n=1 Tax=Dinothrombium tinctorium TaxID=1965070 RepID=A0A443RIA5_9ACAR|nr:uncharacterized protein B4U79_12280 [Dinothrombium tinctorium]
MVCDCILTKEERQRGIFGCGDDCLNRMLMIEWGQFIMEYVGEVLAPKEFKSRVAKYSKENRVHHYFMALKNDEIIDATEKGNLTRFVNHSCDPNAETQKWTVNGELRIGFFAKRNLEIGDEITFDYQFQRYGEKAQRCYCESSNCRGYIGATQMPTIGVDGIRLKQKVERDEEVEEKSEEEFEDLAPHLLTTETGDDIIAVRLIIDLVQDWFSQSELKYSNKFGQIKQLMRYAYKIYIVMSRLNMNKKGLFVFHPFFLQLEEEIEKLTASGGLRNRQQTLLLARLMVRAEDSVNRQKLLEVMKSTQEVAYLRLLLDYHGLQLLWSWMFELEDVWLKAEILEVLEILPIPNKTMLKDSKVLDVVEKWSKLNIEQQATTAQTRSSIEVVEQAAADVLSTAKLDEIGQKAAEEQKPSEIVVKAEGPQVLVKRENDEANTTEMADVCKDSKEKVEEEPSVCEGENAKQPMETDNRPTVVEVSCKNEANDTMKESDSTVNVSKATTMNSEKVSPIVQETKSEGPKPVPNIAMLAARLLNSWKDLKEVFRIPRLERQKRHEDEKEADRKTKELEERRARGLPIIYDKSKRGIDDRDCTIAGILGLRKKAVKRQADDKKVSQSNVNMTSPHTNLINNDMSAPTPPKVNKDAHRLQFEMELMRKQYEEAMKAYKNQMMQYHAMVQQQIMQPQGPPQAPSLHYPNSFEPLPMQPPPQLPHQMPPPPPQHPQPPFYPCDSSFQRFPQPNSVHCNNDYIGTPNSNSYEEYSDRINSSLEICHELSHKPTILLSNSSVLIECTSDEHFLMNDEKAVISTDYGVEYVPVKDKSEAKSKTLFDPIYPAPGVYYKFESKTYFVPQPFDHKGHRVEPVVFEGITLPLPASTTKKVISTAFPRNWRASNDKEGNVYYYNKATKRTQWNLPEQEMECVSNGNCVKTQSESVVISSADSTSTPKDEIEQQREVTPIEMNGETSLSTPDAVSNIDCSGTPLNSLPGSQTFEPDPRKRKQLNNPVAHLLSGTSNITNSDNSLLSSVTANRHYPAITESRTERKMKEKFKAEMSEHIKYCLNPYRKMDCKIGRIVNNEDFKYLARKLTHFVMVKELKHCKSIEELSCNETVKHKAKDYVRKYMAKQGPIYKTEGMEEKDERSPKDGISLDTVLEQSIDAI